VFVFLFANQGAVATIDLLFECGPKNPRGTDIARLLLATGLFFFITVFI
jgi:hypothetical protein